MTPNNREELKELMARTIMYADSSEKETSFDLASAILTALDTAGIDLVPRVATVDAATDGARSLRDTIRDTNQIARARACYTAMLSASPFRKDGV